MLQCFVRVDSSRAGRQRYARKGKLDISVFVSDPRIKIKYKEKYANNALFSKTCERELRKLK